jgi:chemotaxis protein CheC
MLSELERDALAEVFNIGMGQAANSLSEMLQEEIQLSTPSLQLVAVADAVDVFTAGGSERIAGVRQLFSGPFTGQALLLFPSGKSMELVRLLSKQHTPLEQMTELEQETLTEVGNIMVNACLAGLADVFGQSILSDIPFFLEDSIEEALQVDVNGDKILLMLHLEFGIETRDLSGFMLFLVDIASLAVFKQLISERLLQASGF